jgi:hypothetical protein
MLEILRLQINGHLSVSPASLLDVYARIWLRAMVDGSEMIITRKETYNRSENSCIA